jgi:hypothetical protein
MLGERPELLKMSCAASGTWLVKNETIVLTEYTVICFLLCCNNPRKLSAEFHTLKDGSTVSDPGSLEQPDEYFSRYPFIRLQAIDWPPCMQAHITSFGSRLLIRLSKLRFNMRDKLAASCKYLCIQTVLHVNSRDCMTINFVLLSLYVQLAIFY